MLLIILLMLSAIPAFAKVETEVIAIDNVVTNKILVSNSVEKKAWSRTAITASGEEVKDPSGQLVHSAETGAVNSQAIHIGEISEGASDVIAQSVSYLCNYTNQIPENAIHIGVAIPRQNEVNLSGRVVAESYDGTNDIQTVRYSQKLSKAPLRKVDYVFLDETISVRCIWEHPWNTNSFDHVCSFPRPPRFRNMTTVYKSKMHDTFGGSKGFSFGTTLVSVDGRLTFTGSVTNKTTNAVLVFENGVLTNEK